MVAQEGARAAVPGLPFTEDFSDAFLQDPAGTSSNWSVKSQGLLLTCAQNLCRAFAPEFSPSLNLPDTEDTESIALADVDGDGDLDLVVGNDGPGDGRDLAVGDFDENGDKDLVIARAGETNRFHTREGVPSYVISGLRNRATSLRVDTETDRITHATLTAVPVLPPNTDVDYSLSNDGGRSWHVVRPGVPLFFPTLGTDLRWRAELNSLSPILTPRVQEIHITTEFIPSGVGDRVWEDLDGDGIQDEGEPGLAGVTILVYDASGPLLTAAFSQSDGSYFAPKPGWQNGIFLQFFPPAGHTLSPQDQGSDDFLDSDADPATGNTSIITLPGVDHETRWDAGMVPAVLCSPPDEPIYIYDVALTTDGNESPSSTSWIPISPTRSPVTIFIVPPIPARPTRNGRWSPPTSSIWMKPRPISSGSTPPETSDPAVPGTSRPPPSTTAVPPKARKGLSGHCDEQ